MPLYEYSCPTCDQKFELLRPMSRADEPATCPQGHATLQRLLSVFALPRGAAQAWATDDEESSAGGCGCGEGGCGCSI